jgi:hypothetical protein
VANGPAEVRVANRSQELLRAHPEIVFSLVLGLGYLIGKLALGGFKLGAVTSSAPCVSSLRARSG